MLGVCAIKLYMAGINVVVFKFATVKHFNPSEIFENMANKCGVSLKSAPYLTHEHQAWMKVGGSDKHTLRNCGINYHSQKFCCTGFYFFVTKK
jgi:hypothetical protein